MRKALTIVSVWPLGEPVRGRLETMRMVPLRVLAATGLGEAAAAGEAAGLAAGLAAGEAAGLAATAGDAAGAVVGLAAAGAAVGAAGAAVGVAAGVLHAATNRVVPNNSDDRRASSAPRID
jgi:hypothetical protein